MTIRPWMMTDRTSEAFVAGLKGTLGPRAPQHLPPALWIVAGLALQIALLQVAGFVIASTVLFVATAAAFGERRWHLAAPLGLALTLLIYGVFDRLLQLNLPAGFPETLVYGS